MSIYKPENHPDDVSRAKELLRIELKRKQKFAPVDVAIDYDINMLAVVCAMAELEKEGALDGWTEATEVIE